MPPLLPQSAPRHEAEAQNPNLINIGTPCAASPRGSVAIISHKDAENAPHSTLARFGPVFSLILGLDRIVEAILFGLTVGVVVFVYTYYGQ